MLLAAVDMRDFYARSPCVFERASSAVFIAPVINYLPLCLNSSIMMKTDTVYSAKKPVIFVHKSEEIISKGIVTPDGETDFQVRYIRGENVGIICTPTDKSYFLLDSADYWYDLTQEKYPPIMKCSCKNDRFNLTFDYMPRVDTEDFKEINIQCLCTVCRKAKRLPPIKIDYSPSAQLFDHPITFCERPKIKYKTYSLMGYWSDAELLSLSDYLLKRKLFVYCWYWDFQKAGRFFKELCEAELHAFLTDWNKRYLSIYFSEEPLDNIPLQAVSDEKGVYIPNNFWRVNKVIVLHGPHTIISRGLLYQMDFCGEYLDKEGNIVPKSASFCALIQDFRKYSKKLLEK